MLLSEETEDDQHIFEDNDVQGDEAPEDDAFTMSIRRRKINEDIMATAESSPSAQDDDANATASPAPSQETSDPQAAKGSTNLFAEEDDLELTSSDDDDEVPLSKRAKILSEKTKSAKESNPSTAEPTLPPRASVAKMEPFVQTEVYQLGNGGDLIFERDLHALSESLGRSPPVFYGGQVNDQPGGQLQWVIMADLPGKPESPMFGRIQFSLRENNWADGLTRAMQEALARLCGQNAMALQGGHFAHLGRHNSLGVPLNLPYHPVLRHHVDHLDFMLCETRTAMDNSRGLTNYAYNQMLQKDETIKVITKEHRALRRENAKKDYAIHRLKAKMAPPSRASQDAMMQLLQTLMADREAERAERQANIAALQQIAQNNQGHGNHEHPGSKLKNFQNTNPPVFSKTEEPLDADDWLHTMENNLEVAGVEANDKVLFATHYLAGPARAWWTSARALNAGQMMTWADFKLKFSKYHVPPGLIKKMRDEFRELKQGRMTVVEYRDKFLTLSRYA
ncbi:hypothetical protein QYE76_032434 [Lolium multiflorum]|uniref:Retrotransposon gag domain-containing protein n=1 Tax=Lolium multiflorum TaxID=4521 RepID=A0AAD8QTP6_LOLMU|nr:hypothetical protein QYE76_032434 [Lolium multiflorum]